jgi:transcriptional regulator with XRE-family HTH domain
MKSSSQPDVGSRIRALREARGLSLRALADQCRLSVNAISLIERGENSPTVSSLHLLAGALGVPITEFFQEVEEQSAVYVARGGRLGHNKNGILMESLGIGLRNQQLEPFLISVEPGAGSDESVTHPGQEFVHCLEGEVEYHVDDELYRLKPGDSLLLEATSPHFFLNTAAVRATFLVIFQATGNADIGRQRHLEA